MQLETNEWTNEQEIKKKYEDKQRMHTQYIWISIPSIDFWVATCILNVLI